LIKNPKKTIYEMSRAELRELENALDRWSAENNFDFHVAHVRKPFVDREDCKNVPLLIEKGDEKIEVEGTIVNILLEEDRDGRSYGIGISKCAPDECFDRHRGRVMAKYRAWYSWYFAVHIEPKKREAEMLSDTLKGVRRAVRKASKRSIKQAKKIVKFLKGLDAPPDDDTYNDFINKNPVVDAKDLDSRIIAHFNLE